MKSAWAELGPAMSSPVAGMQACFRVALQALARPGRIGEVPAVAVQGMQVPAAQHGSAMSPATAALLLTLLDADTTVTLHGMLASPAVAAWLRFHTGVREALPGEPSAFVVARAAEWTAERWQALELGSDEAPQRGATVVLEVPALAAATDPERVPAGAALTTLQLRGPGIESMHTVVVAGVPTAFWRQRQAMQPLYPRGIELFLTCGSRLVGLPRSTVIALSCGGP